MQMSFSRHRLKQSEIAACCGMILAALAGIKMDAQTAASQNAVSGLQNSATPIEHTFALSIPVGTPLQVALDHEIRVKKTGQPVQGHLMQPVYAFDRLVLPPGTRVQGHISKIGGPGVKQLTWSILNADFTPARPVQVTFDEIVLAGGKHLSLQATVVPGSGEVIRLIDSGAVQNGGPTNPLSMKMNQAKQEWRQAMQQVRQPDKFHRALRIGIAQLPVHPQYLDAGTLYNVELLEPLDFGSEQIKERTVESIGTVPPPGSLLHASLVTPLDSGTTKHGAMVQAVVSRPLFDGNRLILPQGTLLNGSVLEVQPAHRLKHNGELRIGFRELVLPSGPMFRVDTTVEGLQAGAFESPSLDPEGAARAHNPKSRYINTGISVSLAMVGSGGKRDVGQAGNASGGAAAFRLIGIAVGLATRSHTLAILMSAYGGSRSIYMNFFGRGRDIRFPKDTAMEIGIGSQTTAPMSPHP